METLAGPTKCRFGVRRTDSGGLHRCDGNGPLPHTCRQVSECRRGWTLIELLAVTLFGRPVAG
jgi:hypothetical protein